MFCEHCGYKLTDESKFCENCGKPVSATPVTAQQPEPAPQSDVSQQAPQQTAVMSQHAQPSAQAQAAATPSPAQTPVPRPTAASAADEPIYKKKGFIIAIAAVAVVVIVAIVIGISMALSAPGPEVIEDGPTAIGTDSSSSAASSDESSASPSSGNSSSSNDIGEKLASDPKYVQDDLPTLYALTTLNGPDLVALGEALGFTANPLNTSLVKQNHGDDNYYIQIKDSLDEIITPDELKKFTGLAESSEPYSINFNFGHKDYDVFRQAMFGDEYLDVGALMRKEGTGSLKAGFTIFALGDVYKNYYFGIGVPLDRGDFGITLYNEAYVAAGLLSDSYDGGQKGVTPQQAITNFSKKTDMSQWEIHH